MLEPVRKLFASDPEIQRVRQKAYPTQECKDCGGVKYLDSIVFMNSKWHVERAWELVVLTELLTFHDWISEWGK